MARELANFNALKYIDSCFFINSTLYSSKLTKSMVQYFVNVSQSIGGRGLVGIARQASRCQQAFSKPYLVNLISKDT